jgi:hypothetical protein
MKIFMTDLVYKVRSYWRSEKMEMQQMMERLLARIDAWGEEMDARTEAIRAETKVMRDKRMEANIMPATKRLRQIQRGVNRNLEGCNP